MKAKERMYTNSAQDKLVPERSGKAAFLYASIGTEIPESAVKKFGIVDGRKFTKEPVQAKKSATSKKAKSPTANKAKKSGANKGKGKGKGGLTITPLPDADKES